MRNPFFFQNGSSTKHQETKTTSETDEKISTEYKIEQDAEIDTHQKKPAKFFCIKFPSALKNVLQNTSFILLVLTWFLTGGVFKSCLAHEPQRIVHLGYSLKSGAESLAINGAVQFVSRDFRIKITAKIDVEEKN